MCFKPAWQPVRCQHSFWLALLLVITVLLSDKSFLIIMRLIYKNRRVCMLMIIKSYVLINHGYAFVILFGETGYQDHYVLYKCVPPTFQMHNAPYFKGRNHVTCYFLKVLLLVWKSKYIQLSGSYSYINTSRLIFG